MGGTQRLGSFQELLLLALVRLGDNAYGVTIRREIMDRLNRDISVGAVYTTLERLEKMGYVSSRMGEATPERGGRAKRYFKIEATGRRALANSHEMATRMIPSVSSC